MKQMNNSVYIREQIRVRERELAIVEEGLRRVSQQLDDLASFQSRHEQTTSRLEQDFMRRRSQVDSAAIDATRVRSFAGYQRAMGSILEESRNHLTVRNEERQTIVRTVIAKRNDADSLRARQQGIQDHLTQLRRSLKAALQEEAASTA